MNASTKIFTLLFLMISGITWSQSHDVHEEFEHFFDSFSINYVASELGMNEEYALNAQLQSFVDSTYMDFQHTVYQSMMRGNEYTDDQILVLKKGFLQGVHSVIQNTPDFHKDHTDQTPPVKQWNGPCVNMDFEDGTLNGWTLQTGTATGATQYSFGSATAATAGPNHLIFGGGTDPVVGIPCVFPGGGSYSVRLGNGTTSGSGAARMKQSFLVTANNAFFTYNYAVVFQSPSGHSANQRPYFTVRVYGETGTNISCGEYSVYADGNNAPGYQSTTVGGNTILYKNWTTVFTNLTAYIGQNVTIEFTSGDCSLSGHYGYAYVDASCSYQEITATDYDICPGQPSILTAPAGLGSYQWSTGATTQNITVTSGGNYYCVLTPPQGAACAVTLDVDIIEFPEPTAVFTVDQNVVCLGEPITFTDNSTVVSPGIIDTYTWDFDDGIITPPGSGALSGVSATTGTYTSLVHTYGTSGAMSPQLIITTTDGCTDTTTVNLTVNPLPVVVAGVDQTVCDGVAVTLTASGASTYSWDNGVSNGVSFNQPVGTTTYTVSGTDVNGCTNTDQVDVIVNALPVVDAGTDQFVCTGFSVTLAGSGASTYSWDNNVTDNVAFTPAIGSLTYTVTGTDVNGCVDQDQVDVTVYALPVVDAGPDQTVCSGTIVTLAGSGASTYSWDNNVTDNVSFTPAVGTVNYTVTGTDVNGCENTDQVTVLVNALPVVDAGSDQTICYGISITLNGSGASTYSWDNGVTNAVSFVPAVGAHTYTVVGTDANGCQDDDQVIVTVNALPVVDAGPDQQLCDGFQVTLSASGASSYTWDNGVTDGVAFSQAVGTLMYTVTGTDQNGCENNDSVEVIVHPSPIVDAGVDQVVCFGTNVVLSASGATTYTWNQSVTNNVAFAPVVGSLTYQVVGTNTYGCIDSDSLVVTVNPLPIVNAGVDQTICDGDSVTIHATGANTYSWNIGYPDSTTFSPAVGVHIYSVTGTDTNGCQNSDQLTVTVNPNPVVDAGNDIVVCDGESVVLSGTGATTYAWDNNAVNNVPFVPAVGSYVYQVTGYFPTGCSSQDFLSVTVNPRPVVSAYDLVICYGDSAVLSGIGAVSYSWSNGVTDGVPFYPEATSVYTVTGTNVFNCTSTSQATVVVNSLPDPWFTVENSNFTIANTESMFFNNSNNAVAYQWNFGDGSPLSEEVSPYHAFPDVPESYTVTLVAWSPEGCVDTISREIEIKDELLFFVPNAFTPDDDAYNNTFTPVFTSGFDPQEYTLYIFNRWGEIIFESHDTSVGWSGRYGVNGDMSQDGVYIWKILVKTSYSNKRQEFNGHVSLLR